MPIMYSVIVPIKDFPNIEKVSINGKHLLEGKLEALLASKSINEIIVSTDSSFVQTVCEQFPTVKIHLRTKDNKEQSFASLVQEVIVLASFNDVIWSFITCPIDDAIVLEEAISEYESLDLTIYDSLVTCTKLTSYIFDENGPINFHQGKYHKESNNLPDIYQLVNKFFIMRKELQLKYAYPWGKVPFPLIVTKPQAFDVKSYEDLEIFKKVFIND
jgi:CMP-N-acetylneuraminic acid synthetase